MSEEKMKKTMVKICGLRRPEDALAANRLKPDLAGFILSPGFRRSIGPEQAQRLRRILTPDIRTVGVFVDAPFDEILQAAEGGWIDMIQLHGKEDEAYPLAVGKDIEMNAGGGGNTRLQRVFNAGLRG